MNFTSLMGDGGKKKQKKMLARPRASFFVFGRPSGRKTSRGEVPVRSCADAVFFSWFLPNRERAFVQFFLPFFFFGTLGVARVRRGHILALKMSVIGRDRGLGLFFCAGPPAPRAVLARNSKQTSGPAVKYEATEKKTENDEQKNTNGGTQKGGNEREKITASPACRPSNEATRGS